jgi:putative Mn2+ efflux pump MntP
MSLISLLTVVILYPLTLLGDGCVLVAVALAATVGGRPFVWGISFAFFHTLYGLLGIVLAEEVSDYSETLGDVFVLVGAGVLLRHFVNHRLHHQVGGDCSCENHRPMPVKTTAIVSTASAFSLHAFASGAIVQGLAAEELSRLTLIVLIVATSAVIGCLVGTIVLIGDRERLPILRSLDKLPSAVTFILGSVCVFSIHHLLSDVRAFSLLENMLFFGLSLLVVGLITQRVHRGASRATFVNGITTGSQQKNK